MTTRDVRFKCEGGCGAEWINPNHTRCEGCGHNRGPYSIGYHAAWQAATAAAEAKSRRVREAGDALADIVERLMDPDAHEPGNDEVLRCVGEFRAALAEDQP